MNLSATDAAPIEPVSALNKGIGHLASAATPEQIARLGWNLLREDLCLPAAVLNLDRLRHNMDWMERFIAAYGVKFAPHGKTTMAPALFRLQIEAGAWAITLATVQQVHVAYAHGVRRVLMANELVGKQNMAAISRMIANPGFEFYCLADSAELVEQMGKYFAPRGQCLRVLLELGIDGGRAGIRNHAQLDATLAALERWRGAVELCGIELYEGVLGDEAQIRAFCARAVDVTKRLIAEDRFHRQPVLLSGAGSAWYDVVAEEFTAARFNVPVEIVLRPGCYLTHDVGHYREADERIRNSNSVARELGPGLVPALHIWAYVQSVPEAQKAIVGLGRRDAAFDSGLPRPALHFRPGNPAPAVAPGHWVMSKLMDQHGYLTIASGDDIAVGDMIGFDICHPCLTFDKWRTLALVDSGFNVVDLVQTYF